MWFVEREWAREQTSPSMRRRSAERRPHGGSPRAWILEAAARQHMKRCVRPSASWGQVGRCGGSTATRNITSGVVLVAGAHRGYLAAHKRLVLADRGAAQWFTRRESFDSRLHGGSRPYACTHARTHAPRGPARHAERRSTKSGERRAPIKKVVDAGASTISNVAEDSFGLLVI